MMKGKDPIRYYNEAGELHKEDGPAVVHFNPMTSVVCREAWYQNDKRNRDDGPALVLYNGAGLIIDRRYFKEGRRLPEEAFAGIEEGTEEFKFTWDMM